MSDDTCVETLFKEHSFEEIESVRDNLAGEITKRTDLLKSIVKEKYRDVVETSDAIHSMKLNISKVERSVQGLNDIIEQFYDRIRETRIDHSKNVRRLTSENCNGSESVPNRKLTVDGDDTIRRLLEQTSEVWEHFDNGNLGSSIKSHNIAIEMMREVGRNAPKDLDTRKVLSNIEYNIDRATNVIKNHLWFRIQSAEPNQIGVIAGSDEHDLYLLSLTSSIDFLVETFKAKISDISYQAQIRRYQPCTYFNTQTNQVDPQINDLNLPTTGYARIPKSISIELSSFLYEVCRVINTIAGFNLTRTSILESLRLTIQRILSVYSDLLPSLDNLKAETKRKRALQLYFDMNYVRVLLNTSKHIELIEELDSELVNLIEKFELMLDSIELYVISEALHDNVLKFSHSTMRLYGLLIPYLR